MSATNKFHVTYLGGKTADYETSDASVEAFCNSHFGSSWEVAQANGASVVMNGEQAETAAETPAEEAPAEKPKAKSKK